jgi:hypothetical protein
VKQFTPLKHTKHGDLFPAASLQRTPQHFFRVARLIAQQIQRASQH